MYIYMCVCVSQVCTHTHTHTHYFLPEVISPSGSVRTQRSCQRKGDCPVYFPQKI